MFTRRKATGAVNVELTPEDLRELENAAAMIQGQGD
jgi:hypothetical protein